MSLGLTQSVLTKICLCGNFWTAVSCIVFAVVILTRFSDASCILLLSAVLFLVWDYRYFCCWSLDTGFPVVHLSHIQLYAHSKMTDVLLHSCCSTAAELLHHFQVEVLDIWRLQVSFDMLLTCCEGWRWMGSQVAPLAHDNNIILPISELYIEE